MDINKFSNSGAAQEKSGAARKKPAMPAQNAHLAGKILGKMAGSGNIQVRAMGDQRSVQLIRENANRLKATNSALGPILHKLEQDAHVYIYGLAEGPAKTVCSSLYTLTGEKTPSEAYQQIQQYADKDARMAIQNIVEDRFSSDSLDSSSVPKEITEVLIPYLMDSMNALVNPLTGLGVKNIAFANDILNSINSNTNRLGMCKGDVPDKVFYRLEADALNIGNTNKISHLTDMSGLIDILGVSYNPEAPDKFYLNPKLNEENISGLAAYEGKISDNLMNEIQSIMNGDLVLNDQNDINQLLEQIYDETEILGMAEVDDLGRAKMKLAITELDEQLHTGPADSADSSSGGDEATILRKINKNSTANVRGALKNISVKNAAVALVAKWFKHDHGKDKYTGRRGFGVGFSGGLLDTSVTLKEHSQVKSKFELLLTDVKDELGSRNHGLVRVSVNKLGGVFKELNLDKATKEEIKKIIVDVDKVYKEDTTKRQELIAYEEDLFEAIGSGIEGNSNFDPSSVDLFDPRIADIEARINEMNIENKEEVSSALVNYLQEDNNISKAQVKDILVQAQEFYEEANLGADQGEYGLKAFEQKIALLNHLENTYNSALPVAPDLPEIYQDAVDAEPALPQPVAAIRDTLKRYDAVLSDAQKQTLTALENFVYTKDPVTRTYATDSTFSDVAESFIAMHDKCEAMCAGAENLNGLNKIDSSLANKYLRDISDLLQNTLKEFGIEDNQFIVAHKSSKFTLIIENDNEAIDANVKQAISQRLDEKISEFNNVNIFKYCEHNNIAIKENKEALAYLEEKSAKLGKTPETMNFGDVPNPKRDEKGFVVPSVFSSIDKSESAGLQISRVNQKIEKKIGATRAEMSSIEEFTRMQVATTTKNLIDKMNA